MSILIKGLNMPKSCDECFAELYSWCGIAQKPISDITLRSQDCPLVEVPPHGRLIDADALPFEECEYADGSPVFLIEKRAVDNAPTIIEAEVER